MMYAMPAESHWYPALTVGNERMDRSHAQLLKELSQLAQQPDSTFGVAYKRLVDQVERDFAEEEVMMEAIHFSALRSHLEQHARVLSGLHHVLPAVLAGDNALGRKAVQLLPAWFRFHIATMDHALATAIRVSETNAPPRRSGDADSAKGGRANPN